MRSDPFKIHEGSVHDRSLSGYNAARTSGDNMLFLPVFSGWIGKNLKNKRVTLFYLFLLGTFSILSVRILYLQVQKGDSLYLKAEQNRTKTVLLKAPRGIIYDRFGRPLVENISKFYLSIDPLRMRSAAQSDAVRDEILSYFPEQTDHIRAFFSDLSKKSADDVLIDDIPYELALLLMVRTASEPSIQVLNGPRRKYLITDGMGPIIGYVGKINLDELRSKTTYSLTDTIGKEGIERSYETILRGADGKQQLEVDALGREKGALATVAPVKGNDVNLTIDLDMQRKLFSILSSINVANRSPAVGIVMNPQNGEILAMVSVPSYDPNLFSTSISSEDFQKIQDDPQNPLFMRAIAGLYPAGSVFKLAVSAAALDEDLITDSFTVMSTGGIYLGDRFFPDWKSGGHGLTTIYKAISDSVNTFFYTVGGGYGNSAGLGIDTIAAYARKLGFGRKTGIDVSGEEIGFVPNRAWKEQQGEQWYQGDTYNLSIGQGSLLVTPLQIARFTSYFANGGVPVTPHLVRTPESSSAAQTTDPGITKKTIHIIREGMRRTVLSGTATSMQLVPVATAGKTGTAQFNNNKQPHSWFTAFSPFDDPELAVTILVEEGGDRGYSVGAARDFLKWFYESKHNLDSR